MSALVLVRARASSTLGSRRAAGYVQQWRGNQNENQGDRDGFGTGEFYFEPIFPKTRALKCDRAAARFLMELNITYPPPAAFDQPIPPGWIIAATSFVVGDLAVVRQAGPSTLAPLEASRRPVIRPRAKAVFAAGRVERVTHVVVQEHTPFADRLRHGAAFDVSGTVGMLHDSPFPAQILQLRSDQAADCQA